MPIRSTAPDGTVKEVVTESLEDGPDVPYSATLIRPEWRVEKALRLQLVELGGTVEFGTAFRSFDQADEGVAALVVKGGAIETIHARWLVGCDSGRSIVRKQAGISFEGETREEVRMIVVDVEVDSLDRDAWHLWSHEQGMLALCPLPSTNILQFQAGIAPTDDPELSLANMQTILERLSRRDSECKTTIGSTRRSSRLRRPSFQCLQCDHPLPRANPSRRLYRVDIRYRCCLGRFRLSAHDGLTRSVFWKRSAQAFSVVENRA